MVHPCDIESGSRRKSKDDKEEDEACSKMRGVVPSRRNV